MNRLDMWNEGMCTVVHTLPFDNFLVESLTGYNNQDVIDTINKFDELVKKEEFYVIGLTDILHDALSCIYNPKTLPQDNRCLAYGVDYFALVSDHCDNDIYGGGNGWDIDVVDEVCRLAYLILNFIVIGLTVNLNEPERTVLGDMVMDSRDIFDLWGDNLMVSVSDDTISFTSIIQDRSNPSYEVKEFEVYSSLRCRVDALISNRPPTLWDAVRTL